MIFILLLATSAPAQWTQATPATVPAGRAQMAMCYDWFRQHTVMFGGVDESLVAVVSFNDTWTYDGLTWSQASPATSPAPRQGMPLVFDLQRGVCVMYGGAGDPSGPATLGRETWEWDGIDWTRATTAHDPGDRVFHGMAYDLGRSRVVLYGGQGRMGPWLDTWEYDGQDWSQVLSGGGPGPRSAPVMCYHAGLGKTVLFGGFDPLQRTGLDDTWTFDGSTWTRVAVQGPVPSPREHARMVFDFDRNVCVLFGGVEPLSQFPFSRDLADTWEFDGVRWTRISSSTSSIRVFPGMAMDQRTQRIVTFGGSTSATTSGRATDETWELSGFFRTFGTGCVGTNGVPTLSSASIPRIGSGLTIHFTGLSSGGPSAFCLGFSDEFWAGLPLPIDMSPLGFTGCAAHASIDLAFDLPTSASGTATWSQTVPPDQTLVGLEFFPQALSVDPLANPGGVIFSNAGSIVVGA